MYVCYLDEAGGAEAPDIGPAGTPVMVILGLIVDAASVPAMTRDFLALKRRHFPGRFTSGLALDHILTEVKGSDILQMTRKKGRNPRRQAQRLRDELLTLVETHGCRIVGRVWIKDPGKGMDPASSYCYAVQDISSHYGQHLEAQDDVGVLIADGRQHHTNLMVAHSIFTQKWRTGGDPYPAMREVPLFAASDNHAGLQIADLLASTLVFPMAVSAYCPRRPGGNPHYSGTYAGVRSVFGKRVGDLQFRYRDETGKWRGGLVVSDHIAHKPGSYLFGR
ncbi:DUF3800 domain-containing protein [Actinocorallia longicatena]|uniref:DUF3800 domain-containing protein n=1 Tax=Actinocorallia longicatena TaxID=111803 RepID=A0ABP6Q9H2_9ACTN